MAGMKPAVEVVHMLAFPEAAGGEEISRETLMASLSRDLEGPRRAQALEGLCDLLQSGGDGRGGVFEIKPACDYRRWWMFGFLRRRMPAIMDAEEMIAQSCCKKIFARVGTRERMIDDARFCNVRSRRTPTTTAAVEREARQVHSCSVCRRARLIVPIVKIPSRVLQ